MPLCAVIQRIRSFSAQRPQCRHGYQTISSSCMQSCFDSDVDMLAHEFTHIVSFVITKTHRKFICSNPISGNHITTTVCTWHESCAVVSCANMCSDHFIGLWLTEEITLVGFVLGKKIISVMGYRGIVLADVMSWSVRAKENVRPFAEDIACLIHHSASKHGVRRHHIRPGITTVIWCSYDNIVTLYVPNRYEGKYIKKRESVMMIRLSSTSVPPVTKNIGNMTALGFQCTQVVL